jgi:hypothetical protein
LPEIVDYENLFVDSQQRRRGQQMTDQRQDTGRHENVATSELVQAAGANPIVAPLLPKELYFLNEVAIPQMDRVTDNTTLKELADTFWSLCLMEFERARYLNSRAASVFGLAGIASAVVATVSLPMKAVVLIALAVVAALALLVMMPRPYGSFVDEDVFLGLTPCGAMNKDQKRFSDADVYRCFVRELTTQRWLYFSRAVRQNNRAYRLLRWTHVAAIVAMVLIVGAVIHGAR